MSRPTKIPHISKLTIAVFAVIWGSHACSAYQDQANEAGVAYFEKHIRPLLVQHCYQCHSAAAKEREGNLSLDSRLGWLEGGENGPSVIPGDVDSSLLIRAVRYSDPDFQMPPIKALSAEAIAKFENWVRMGAPGPGHDKVITSVNPSDPIAGKNHWAFQPLQRNEMSVGTPAAARDKHEWAQSPIDQFVLAKQTEQGLSPVQDADPRDLVRRVHFQLTGLPPSIEQVRTFIGDEQPDALERLVDGLLASPAFSERWGRHWLDLARYSDSNGLDENFLFREAWRYRNWVINAINKDLPIDRFVLEQIAGDLLPFDSIEQRDQQRIAAGFLVIGPKVLLGNIEKNQRMEIADEQIDTIGKAILGQTLGCARCHDHKFDPVPTADYYALAGILASTSVMEKRHMLNEQRVMERLVGLGPNGGDADDAYEAYWRDKPKLIEKKNRAETALEALKKDKGEQEFSALREKNPEAVAIEAINYCRTGVERIEAQQALIAELTSAITTAPIIPSRAMIPADVKEPADEHIRIAGQFDRLGESVPRGFLTVLSKSEKLEIQSQQSGRIELAHWLFDLDSPASQLVARVQANRIWHHLIGIGLVRTVDNFGRTGEPPSHPELLDYLASELIESGWSTKALVRQIVLSRTFALSSKYDAINNTIDPENRLLWRAHRRRLDPESFRDAMLVAAGKLDWSPMDSSVSYLGDQATAVGANKIRRRTDFPNRSIYLPVIRNDLPELFNVFDFADPHITSGARANTSVPTQGLFVLNDEMVMQAADATAKRILAECPTKDVDLRTERMFELILQSNTTHEERQELRSFLTQTEVLLFQEHDKEAECRALAIACHAVFASSRFLMLE